LLQNSFDQSSFIPYWKSVVPPAAGANVSITLPMVSLQQLALLTFAFTTDANVANRFVYVTLVTGGIEFILGASGFAHTASTSLKYFGSSNATANLTGHVYAVQIPLADIQFTDYTATIGIKAANIQAGDQFLATYAMFKMWHGHL